MLVIRHAEGGKWRVGFYEPPTPDAHELFTELGAFHSQDAAMQMVHYLNGGTAHLNPRDVICWITEWDEVYAKSQREHR